MDVIEEMVVVIAGVHVVIVAVDVILEVVRVARNLYINILRD